MDVSYVGAYWLIGMTLSLYWTSYGVEDHWLGVDIFEASKEYTKVCISEILWFAKHLIVMPM